MGSTTVKITHSQRSIFSKQELELAVENAKRNLGKAAANTKATWLMFDDAVEDGDKEAKNDLAELAAFCEAVQSIAYQELDDAKRALLAMSN